MAASDMKCITDSAEGVIGWFGLANDINLTNMMLQTPDKHIRKYEDAVEIQRAHFEIRLNFQEKRKDWILEKLNHDKLMAENKVRFIQMQIEEKIKIHRREISDVNRELKELKFTPQS